MCRTQACTALSPRCLRRDSLPCFHSQVNNQGSFAARCGLGDESWKSSIWKHICLDILNRHVSNLARILRFFQCRYGGGQGHAVMGSLPCNSLWPRPIGYQHALSDYSRTAQASRLNMDISALPDSRPPRSPENLPTSAVFCNAERTVDECKIKPPR